ncbi:GNAT family N-acetyltransferase [Microvirga alba]|uniref:GNAT family N-acetyltransferase n=1 Tax=Microvirga alba TaxID=2791025 RepID=A0A931BR62_9HYPH|nr:GNAT family N-acetyltransferase [Microvirga alba]MBF9234159.1 GNAT family N-acetyltransferase [Microvirga alba]
MSGLRHPVVSVPVLETERLTLRGHRLDDFSACAAMWGDPEVTRFISGKPSSNEEVWARLLRYVGHWALLGFGYWAIEEKATGAFAGELGFADYKRDIEPSLAGLPELGWVLSPRVHGKGYATEAARAAIAWGDAHFGNRRTACIIAPENLASIRVAEKCGFRELQATTYKGQPTIMFTRERGA